MGQHLLDICADELREGSQRLQVELSRLRKSNNSIDESFQVPFLLGLLLNGAEEVSEVSTTLMHHLDQRIYHHPCFFTVLKSEFATHESVVLATVKIVIIGFQVLA